MKKIFIKLSLFATAAFTLASCTKGFDENFNTTYEEKSVMINYAVEKPITVIGVTPPSTGNLMVDLGNLSFSSTKDNESDLTVNLVINNSLLADYNTTNFTNYVPFPSNLINLPLTYKIPRGQKQVAMVAEINTALLDLSKSYAIGISIASVTGGDNSITINNLYKDCLYGVVIKNKYDGRYEFKGRIAVTPDRPATFSSATFIYPYEIHLITTGGNSIKWSNTAFAGAPGFHPLINNNAPSGFGTTEVSMSFNASDALATVSNTFPGSARGFIFNPAVTDSRYQTSNKTLYAAIMMTQPTFQNLPLFDTLRYLGPR